MANSMTGYGRHKELVGSRDICFEIKSVNSRYLDLNIKLGRLYVRLEDKIRNLVSSRISRGKVDVFLTVDNIDGEKTELALNKEYLEAYLALLNNIKSNYGIGGEIEISMLAGKSDIFNVRKLDEDSEELWAAVEPVVEKAVEKFLAMRETEGASMVADVREHMGVIASLRAEIKGLAPAAINAANEKMIARVKELLSAVEPDEGRLLTECAIFADKADINEELARLNSHFEQLDEILGEKGPIGRKLDFLVQEINREINTIGSKSSDMAITKAVIAAKSEIEKIREQIQNIE